MLGQTSLDAKKYARAVEWFEEAYILAGKENNQTIGQQQVLDIMKEAVQLVKMVI